MHYKRSVTDRALAMLLSLVLCLTMVRRWFLPLRIRLARHPALP